MHTLYNHQCSIGISLPVLAHAYKKWRLYPAFWYRLKFYTSVFNAVDNPNPGQKDQTGTKPQVSGGECCATALLSAPEDFKNTPPRLRKIFEDSGRIPILNSKSHCEINWIEYYWGSYKWFARTHCNYFISGKRHEFSACTRSTDRSLANC